MCGWGTLVNLSSLLRLRKTGKITGNVLTLSFS